MTAAPLTPRPHPTAGEGAEGVAGVDEGVGRTALLVAAARAIETHRSDSLAADPYAELFVRAARSSAGWPVRPADVPDLDADPVWGRLGRYFGLRTRVLDDFLLRAVDSGIRQVVLLGAGLDTRAHRLPWPPGCTVHEVDTAGVLAFKDRVLAGVRPAVTPAATRRVVPADLREDWAPALLAAGFNPGQPTAWLAEGVLLYLPSAAERYLIGTAARLSAPGSTLCYEVKLGVEAAAVRTSPVYAETKRRLGVDLIALFDPEPRPDSAADLTALGWTTTVRTPFDFSRAHGRGPRPEPRDALGANRWIFATA
jgi:methyltransferase (TIGR00027 family)